MDEALPRVRQVEWLVGPLVTLAAVAALLVVARNYDRLPLQAPPCGFRTVLGVPCPGCGGTRAMQALAGGKVPEAIRFNPLVVFGVATFALWPLAAASRFVRGVPYPPPAEQNRRILRNTLVIAALIAVNWIYLILFLK